MPSVIGKRHVVGSLVSDVVLADVCSACRAFPVKPVDRVCKMSLGMSSKFSAYQAGNAAGKAAGKFPRPCSSMVCAVLSVRSLSVQCSMCVLAVAHQVAHGGK